MSALLTSLSPSQSHYVRRITLNSNQGKIIPSVVFLKNNLKKLQRGCFLSFFSTRGMLSPLNSSPVFVCVCVMYVGGGFGGLSP